MTDVRDSVTLHPETVSKGEALAAEREKAKRKPKVRKPPVRRVKVEPKVWKKALKIAGGDAKRLVVESPTSVLVRNK